MGGVRLTEQRPDDIPEGVGRGLDGVGLGLIGLRRGGHGGYAVFNPEDLLKVEAGVREEFDRLVRAGVTPDELDKARKGCREQMRVRRTSDATLASTLVQHLHLGRTLAFDAELERTIQALTPDAVNAAIRRHFDPRRLTMVVAGDFQEEKAKPKRKGDAPEVAR